ncbi:hypothetical protein ES705_30015 [subsurface metagenome]
MAAGYWDLAMAEERLGLSAKAKDHFDKALAEWLTIIEQLPETTFTTARAHHMAGEYHRHFNEYEKAIPYYQTILDTWPEYGFVEHAWRMVKLLHERIANRQFHPFPPAP